jgi:hypothetical protein
LLGAAWLKCGQCVSGDDSVALTPSIVIRCENATQCQANA